MIKKNNKGKALVAPLDWGLGHTTRCIPVIELLQQNGYEVIIAGEGRQLRLLQQEFPDLSTLELPGYRIQYTQYKRLLPLKILCQLPKILRIIGWEHRWLQAVVADHNIQLVVSDNRFGLWTSLCRCVFITHQLAIQTPFGWLSRITRGINYRFINRYSSCWVPDVASVKVNLAGALSHPAVMPAVPVSYVGPLSRLRRRNEAAVDSTVIGRWGHEDFDFSDGAKNERASGEDTAGGGAAEERSAEGTFVSRVFKYKWLFMLSGPEPQRSLLETKLITAAGVLGAPILLLRARPGDTELPDVPANCTVVNHLATDALRQAFADSEFVVSRCGYTTVMELLLLKKQSVLIPTPGQTEQEYLAGHLLRQQWCYSCGQDDDLVMHLTKAMRFGFREPEDFESSLQAALERVEALATGDIA